MAYAWSPAARVFKHRDFRLLWTGAFLSFVGSWVQTVGQGYLVYELTKSETALAGVAFAASLPVMLIGPVAGALVDTVNKRRLLVACQILLSCNALFLAIATYMGFVVYWHVVAAALVVGLVGAFEMPTRQSVVSRVVPVEDLPAAIPLNAMTFNMARLVGPAIGGLLLAKFGVSACYALNAFSYTALIFGAMAIRADLRAVEREPQPIKDLVLEGMRYTLYDRALRTLFVLECLISVFGIFYIPLVPAIAFDMLGLDKSGMAMCYTAMGVGSILALLVIAGNAHRGIRRTVLQVDMTLMGIALIAMALVPIPLVAYGLFALLGFSAVAHFNTTNTLFQLLSPDHLRGRVLSMHVWALSGLNPVGVIFFGWLAENVSLQAALQLGGACVLAGAAYAWMRLGRIPEVA